MLSTTYQSTTCCFGRGDQLGRGMAALVATISDVNGMSQVA